jgi:hypothetical protein
MSGAAFQLAGKSPPCLRIGYGVCDERELELGVQRLRAALKEPRR